VPFDNLNLGEELLKSIKLLGYTEPTGIQAKCIPLILAGKDVIGQSLTGSGKTAAFGLPTLGRIVAGNGIQMLVLTPTRELCAQVRDHLDQMSKFLPINVYAIYGGVGFFQQYEDIKNAEVIVATPGRLLDHIRRGTIKFNDIKFIVLDEADKMLEMGFEEDVSEIISRVPKQRQTIFFSATMPPSALRLINKYMKTPVLIKEKLQVDRSLLKQVYYEVPNNDKFSLLVKLLKDNPGGSAIVFCGTKRAVDKIARNLRKNGIQSMPVHGDLTQSKRIQAVEFLRVGKIDVLVATDVAARGLDIKDVTHIYNYDVPRTAEEYTHRIGRTARAGKKGDAVTLLSERDYKNFESVLRDRSLNIEEGVLPQFEKIEFSHLEERGGFDRGDRGGRGFSRGGGRSFGGGRREGGFGGGRREGGFGGGRREGGHGRGKPFERDNFSSGPRNNFSRDSPRPRREGQARYGGGGDYAPPSAPQANRSYGPPQDRNYGAQQGRDYTNAAPSTPGVYQNKYAGNPKTQGHSRPFDKRAQQSPRRDYSAPSHDHSNKSGKAFYGSVHGKRKSKGY